MQFTETQRLNSTGFQILYWVSSLPAVFIVFKEAKDQGLNAQILEAAVILFFFTVIYFMVFRLPAKTRIDSVGVHYKYWPFIYKWRTIGWREIASIEIKPVNPLSDFGGWGYRFGWGKKKGIIMGSDKAIYINLNSQKVFVITTDLPDKAQDAINQWHPINLL